MARLPAQLFCAGGPVILCRGGGHLLWDKVSDGALACPTQWTWAEAIIQDKLWMARLPVQHSGQGRRPCDLGDRIVLVARCDMGGYEC
jgi:hypothetical protein